jgi:hypothetical protein
MQNQNFTRFRTKLQRKITLVDNVRLGAVRIAATATYRIQAARNDKATPNHPKSGPEGEITAPATQAATSRSLRL